MDSSLLEFRGATRVMPAYGDVEIAAVRDITARVRRGARVAVVGPSGSGKTTLIHLAAGLDTPTSGSVAWPAIGGAIDRPGTIGVVFQAPSLIPWLSVSQNVVVPLLARGTRPNEARDRVHAVLAAFDLAHLAARMPDGLSGGQAQRVSTARALVSRPSLVLADEPTGQLDRATATDVVRIMLDEAGPDAGVLVTTHDASIADLLPERWTMTDGELHTS